MAWLSFWLNKTEVVGRLLLILVTNLMMVTAVMLMNYFTPMYVSYTRAIDVWTGWCLTFLFFALAEFIVVNFIARRESSAPEGGGEIKGGWNIKESFKNSTLADKLDITSRIIYPIAFVIFVVIYAGMYCGGTADNSAGG